MELSSFLGENFTAFNYFGQVFYLRVFGDSRLGHRATAPGK